MGQRIVSKWKACGTCVTLYHRHALRAEFELEIVREGLFLKIGTTWQNVANHVAFHVANHVA